MMILNIQVSLFKYKTLTYIDQKLVYIVWPVFKEDYLLNIYFIAQLFPLNSVYSWINLILSTVNDKILSSKAGTRINKKGISELSFWLNI